MVKSERDWIILVCKTNLTVVIANPNIRQHKSILHSCSKVRLRKIFPLTEKFTFLNLVSHDFFYEDYLYWVPLFHSQPLNSTKLRKRRFSQCLFPFLPLNFIFYFRFHRYDRSLVSLRSRNFILFWRISYFFRDSSNEMIYSQLLKKCFQVFK